MRKKEAGERRRRAAGELEGRKLEGLIVSSAANLRYLTGFTGSNGLLLLWREGAALFTDPRYALQASEECDCAVRVARGPLYAALMKAAARRRLGRLGFEGERLSFHGYERLRDALPLGGTLEPVAGLVEGLRMVKSPAEIERIRRSAMVAAEAYQRAIRRARPGLAECELAAEIETQMRRLGAEGAAFETIVAAGARSALPHARPTANALGHNQLVLVDMGASREGYASDMTRMAFLGKPGQKIRWLYAAVLEAQLAAIQAVRAGVPAGRVDRAARQVLRARGLERAFVHSTGHGLGLEIHEPPRLGRREKTPLEAGMVVTIEPGAYLEGLGGIRIEDTVVVTSSGCEVLTPTAKELLLL